MLEEPVMVSEYSGHFIQKRVASPNRSSKNPDFLGGSQILMQQIFE
jgi:hypothetical protein